MNCKHVSIFVRRDGDEGKGRGIHVGYMDMEEIITGEQVIVLGPDEAASVISRLAYAQAGLLAATPVPA